MKTFSVIASIVREAPDQLAKLQWGVSRQEHSTRRSYQDINI